MIRVCELLPGEVRFCQRSTNGSLAILESFEQRGWVGSPIDVVRIRDGGLTTIDNARVLAASITGIALQAIVHDFDEPLAADQISRFKVRVKTPVTWGEAICARIEAQGAAFHTRYPSGGRYTGVAE